MKTITTLLLVLSLGACASAEGARKPKDPAETARAQYVDFPVAEAPRFDGDGRSQLERDLETIGRE